MRLLLAVGSITTLEILLDEMMVRSWPGGTEARVLSIVEDSEVPLETWRAEGYGVTAVRHEMRRRGDQITTLASLSKTRRTNWRKHPLGERSEVALH
jgi:hypothetical protein